MKMKSENTISKSKNILIVLSNQEAKNKELHDLIANFCGTVVSHFAEIQGDIHKKIIYVCGDIDQLKMDDTPFYIIKELSHASEKGYPKKSQIVTLGQVPIIVHDAGVYFRQFLEEGDYFNKVKKEHMFQDLTESNKPGKALRTGMYLTDVSREVTAANQEILHYRLLRCSSNFSGPTDNFRETDRYIMKTMNEAAKFVFEQETNLNHVLAQIYENKKNPVNLAKESKAKIPAHSDKTKDMPKEALIAFCTFYDPANFQHLKPSKTDPYDWCYKDISGLTRLHFKLKNSVMDTALVKEFTVILYPNSVFLIPLSTNRLYTHEIKPSILTVDKIPTRLGYVVRCSKTEAIFMNNQTFIHENGHLVRLEPMTHETMTQVKNLYFEENKTENTIQYGDVLFSMNAGDYQKPIF
jgi:hypothetical protein